MSRLKINVWGIQFIKILFEHIPCTGHRARRQRLCSPSAKKQVVGSELREVNNRITHERDPSRYPESGEHGADPSCALCELCDSGGVMHPRFLICKQGANSTFVVGLL